MVATPLGRRGRGGIDRLNDEIFDAMGARPELNISARRLVTRGQGSLLAAQFVFALAIIRFCFAVFRRDVDLLHIHLSDRGSAYRKALLGDLARLLRVPYVVHLHGAIFVQFWSATSPRLSRAIERLFKQSNHIVVMGQYWACAIIERVPTAAQKISVVPNATHASGVDQLPSETGQVRITCLGQLGHRKGTSELIDAFQRLKSRADWKATVAGDGMVEEYRAKVRSVGIEDRVEIPGWLDPAGTEDLLRRTDILVLPSFSENLPMVIIEAFAHGVPVISTPVGAIPEVVREGRTGLLVPPGHVTALARAIERLIEDSALRQSLGDAARREHAERYEIGCYVRKLAQIWQCSVAP